MKKAVEESRRWFRQAEHDLRTAEQLLTQHNFSYTCFLAEQAAQKALKAFLLSRGERYLWEHSIQKLAQKAAFYNKQIGNLQDEGARLDKFYLPTRYPDALPYPAIPCESFTQTEAQEALDIARRILGLVKEALR
jgi:HEPN domain-containing protein